MIAREKFTGVNSITFNRRFKDDNDCYEYLSLVKWEGGLNLRNVNIINFRWIFNIKLKESIIAIFGIYTLA
jgi:hypothetical protein